MKKLVLINVFIIFVFMIGCSDNKEVINSYNVTYQILNEDDTSQFIVEYISYKNTVSIDTVKGIFLFSARIYADSVGITATALEPRENNKIKAMLYIDDELVEEKIENDYVSVSYFNKK